MFFLNPRAWLLSGFLIVSVMLSLWIFKPFGELSWWQWAGIYLVVYYPCRIFAVIVFSSKA